MAQEKDSKAGKLVYYIGKDPKYAKNLQERIVKDYSYIDGVEFVLYQKFDAAHYETIFLDLLEAKPIIIYIDYTSDTDHLISLTNLITRDFNFSQVATVVLVDSKEQLPKARLTQADFVHIKCGEIYDVLYDPFYLACKKVLKNPDYAKAQFLKTANLYEEVFISFMTTTYMRVETNMPLTEGEEISLQTEIPKNIIPSKNFLVQAVYTNDLIYDFKFGYDLKYQILDEPEFTEDEEEDENFEDIKDVKYKEFDDLLERQEKKLKEWIDDKANYSNEKKTKVLAYDEFLDIFQDEVGVESKKGGPFTLRIQTTIEGALAEVGRLRPEVVAFQYGQEAPKEKKEEGKDKKNEKKEGMTGLEKMTEIMKVIKGIEGYTPYVLIFNTFQYDSRAFQEIFKYSLILSNPTMINKKFLAGISTMLSEKKEKRLSDAIKQKVMQLRKSDPKKYARLRESDLVESKAFLDKRSAIALATIKHSIDVFDMTESELSFLSDREHTIGGRVGIDFPVEVLMTLVPSDDKKPNGAKPDQLVYHALFNNMNELNKQDVRKFVNKIFFSDLDEKRKAEAEEYKKIQDDAATKRSETESEEGGESGEPESEES